MAPAKKTRVLFVQPSAAPYRTALYEQLSDDYEIAVVYIGGRDPSRHWSSLADNSRFTEKELPCFKLPIGSKHVRFAFRGVYSLVKASDVVVLCTNAPDTLTYIVTGSIARWLRKTTVCLVSINSEYRFIRAQLPFIGVVNMGLRFLACLPLRLSQQAIGYCKSSEELSRHFGRACTSSSQYYPLAEEYGVFTESDLLDRVEARNQDPVIRICILGYVNPRKGVKEALMTLRAHGLLEQVSIEIVGALDKNSAYGRDLLAFSSSNVIFRGNYDSSRKRRLFQEVDAMLFPTLHDSWGHVLVEAMYFGVTVVASGASMAAKDLVKNSVNGFLYQDEAELVQAVNQVRARKRALEIGLTAKRDAERFNASTLVAWRRLFSGLVK